MKQKIKFKMSDIPVYEHLEHHVKNTTYVHRWKLFQQMYEFIDLAKKKKIIRPASK